MSVEGDSEIKIYILSYLLTLWKTSSGVNRVRFAVSDHKKCKIIVYLQLMCLFGSRSATLQLSSVFYDFIAPCG